MKPALALLAITLSIATAPSARAQTLPDLPPPPALPLWDVQIGASFVGTNGNSDTATTGLDFTSHRRGAVWHLESAATAVRTSSDDATTAERYAGMFQAQRTLLPIVGLSTGVHLERDRFSGLDARSILDGGLSWALVHHPKWTLDGVSSIAWLHESRAAGGEVSDPIGVLQLLSRIPIGAAGDTTQRFTYYPNFKTASAYRSEAEFTMQAAMNAHLALKIGYLLRYSHNPVPGFRTTDNTTTVSVVLRWKASTAAH
jgi:putative salt-induced outer membrane protein YdiY